jgi:Mrr N-terminal domain
VIILRNLKVGQRIESGGGEVVGKLALLKEVIYEKRGNGEWRRVKDQARGRRKFDEVNGKRRRGEWPSRKQVQGALLLVLEALGVRIVLKERQAEVLEALADHFGLDEARRNLKHPTAATRWANMVHWAKLGLAHEGKLDPDAPYGTWALAPDVLPKAENFKNGSGR